MAYGSDPTPLTLSEVLTTAPQLRPVAVSRYFEVASRQHNALEQFTSVVDPKTMANGGVRSIFAKRSDLSKGGGMTVHFGTIGVPAGPGVKGDTELTGATSKSRFGSYPVIVDWVRDGVEWTKDDVAHLAAGGSLEQVSVDLLSEKMGITKQNQGFKRLIDAALASAGTMGVDGANVYRPNNRISVNALTADDTISLETIVSAKARLGTLGAKPLKRTNSANGSPVNGYMLFSTTTGLIGVRNDSGFQTAVANGDQRGAGNANFTGELLDWQGNSIYELTVTDMDWDDYKGGPLIAKAVCGVTVELLADTDPRYLVVNASNTTNQYFQWWGGKAYTYNRIDSLVVDTQDYYGWAINPDGSRVFFKYAASGNNGNKITISKILSTAIGTTSIDDTTVGGLYLGSGASVSSNVLTLGVGTTLPTSGPNGDWVYSNKIVAGAVLIQANSRGVPYSRSFMFGSMAAAFATGSVEMSPIQQVRDFGFVQGRGFEMIYGSNVCKNSANVANGYLLIEHAVEHEGYPVPSQI